MKKTALVIIIAIIVFGLLGLFIFKMIASPAGQTPATNPSGSLTGPTGGTTVPGSGGGAPGSGGSVVNTGAAISINGQGGATIQVNNFIKDPATKKDTINPGHYLLGTSPSGNELTSTTTASAYSIQYIDSDQSFTIELLQEPIAGARSQAEQYLMTELGISQTDMCKLNYTLGAPWWVNQIYAGKNLGFSFCPGAAPL